MDHVLYLSNVHNKPAPRLRIIWPAAPRIVLRCSDQWHRSFGHRTNEKHLKIHSIYKIQYIYMYNIIHNIIYIMIYIYIYTYIYMLQIFNILIHCMYVYIYYLNLQRMLYSNLKHLMVSLTMSLTVRLTVRLLKLGSLALYVRNKA